MNKSNKSNPATDFKAAQLRQHEKGCLYVDISDFGVPAKLMWNFPELIIREAKLNREDILLKRRLHIADYAGAFESMCSDNGQNR